MRLPRSILAVVAFFVTEGVAPAQPEHDLQAAVDGLLGAGNYTWELQEEMLSGQGKTIRLPTRARGETTIGGFTRAQIRRGDAVLFGHEAAYALAGGWRYFKDIAGEDVAELTKKTGIGARSLRYVQPLPHDVLQRLVDAVRDVRKDGSALVGDIDPTVIDALELRSHLQLGRPLPSPLPVTRNRLGLPVPVSPPITKPRPRSNMDARLVIYETGGVLERFEVEFSRATTVLNGPNAGDHDVSEWKYVVEFSAIGHTKPEIPPEARALFLSAPAER